MATRQKFPPRIKRFNFGTLYAFNYNMKTTITEKESLRLVCAWCSCELPGSNRQSLIVSHGICPCCKEKFMTRKPLAKQTNN